MSQVSPSHIRATAVRVATLRRLALSVLFTTTTIESTSATSTIATTSYQTTCTVSERTFNKRQHANARCRVELSLPTHRGITTEFFLNEAELSMNSMNSGNLTNHWSMSLVPCLAGAVVASWSLTFMRGNRFNGNKFFTQFSEIFTCMKNFNVTSTVLRVLAVLWSEKSVYIFRPKISMIMVSQIPRLNNTNISLKCELAEKMMFQKLESTTEKMGYLVFSLQFHQHEIAEKIKMRKES